MTITEAAKWLGKSTHTVYALVADGKVTAGRAPQTNKSGRTMMVIDLSEEALRAYLAKAAEEEARLAREQEEARQEREQEKAKRAEMLKRPRTGEAAAIVKGCGKKSIKQLARELGISTARVREIYEAEGCL